MTHRDVMIQILSEVSGKSVDVITKTIDGVIRRAEFTKPGSSKGFYKELSQAEAEKLMNELRKEKSGILNWLIEGSQKAHSFLEKNGRQN